MSIDVTRRKAETNRDPVLGKFTYQNSSSSLLLSRSSLIAYHSAPHYPHSERHAPLIVWHEDLSLFRSCIWIVYPILRISHSMKATSLQGPRPWVPLYCLFASIDGSVSSDRETGPISHLSFFSVALPCPKCYNILQRIESYCLKRKWFILFVFHTDSDVLA